MGQWGKRTRSCKNEAPRLFRPAPDPDRGIAVRTRQEQVGTHSTAWMYMNVMLREAKSLLLWDYILWDMKSITYDCSSQSQRGGSDKILQIFYQLDGYARSTFFISMRRFFISAPGVFRIGVKEKVLVQVGTAHLNHDITLHLEDERTSMIVSAPKNVRCTEEGKFKTAELMVWVNSTTHKTTRKVRRYWPKCFICTFSDRQPVNVKTAIFTVLRASGGTESNHPPEANQGPGVKTQGLYLHSDWSANLQTTTAG